MIQSCLLVSTILFFVSNGLGPRVYTGTQSLGSLSLEINILAGYGSSGAIKDGVNVTLSGSQLNNQWIGVGFALSMSGAPALICANDESTTQERQLGPPSGGGAGTLLTSVGSGTCVASGAPELIWEMDGYNFANNLYTFPSDGSDIVIIYAYGSGSSFVYHGASNRGNDITITFTCQGECETDEPTTSPTMTDPTTSPVLAPTESPTINEGSGKIYTGSQLLYSPIGLTATITIKTGFLANETSTNGVDIELSNSASTYDVWTGIGFGQMMDNSFALTCSDTNGPNLAERQLGNQAPGNELTGTGEGECATLNGALSWSLTGFVTVNNIYTFPQNGSDIGIIWGVGMGQRFQQHAVRGITTIQFECTFGCTSEPTLTPSMTPTMTPTMDTVSPSMSPTNSTILPSMSPTNMTDIGPLPTPQPAKSNKINTFISIFILLCCIMYL